MKHLVSADVRGALRTDPLFANMESAARGLIRKLPDRFEAKLRLRIDGPVKVAKAPTRPNLESRYISHQLRSVTHSSERATHVLGYTRVIEFRESMARFRRWYTATTGMDTQSWRLARELFRCDKSELYPIFWISL